MTRKIILSCIVGTLLSGCVGGDVSPESLGIDGASMFAQQTKKTSPLDIYTVSEEGEVLEYLSAPETLSSFDYKYNSGLVESLFRTDLKKDEGLIRPALEGRSNWGVLRLTGLQKATFSKSSMITPGVKDDLSVLAGFALKDQASLDISFETGKTVMSAFLVAQGKSATDRVNLYIKGGVNFLTKGGKVTETNIEVTNSTFTVSGNKSTVPEGWVFGGLVLGPNTLLKTNFDIVVEESGNLIMDHGKIETKGDILVKSGIFKISNGSVICKELVNESSGEFIRQSHFVIGAGSFTGTIINKNYMNVYGGIVDGNIDNQKTFHFFGGQHKGQITNQKSGIINDGWNFRKY